MRIHRHPPRVMLYVPAARALGIAALIVFSAAPSLHGQPVPPSSCTSVAERAPHTPNVVWGERAPDTFDDACTADLRDDLAAAGCLAIGAELEWFWGFAAVESVETVDGCCPGCVEVQERDGRPAGQPD